MGLIMLTMLNDLMYSYRVVREMASQVYYTILDVIIEDCRYIIEDFSLEEWYITGFFIIFSVMIFTNFMKLRNYLGYPNLRLLLKRFFILCLIFVLTFSFFVNYVHVLLGSYKIKLCIMLFGILYLYISGNDKYLSKKCIILYTIVIIFDLFDQCATTIFIMSFFIYYLKLRSDIYFIDIKSCKPVNIKLCFFYLFTFFFIISTSSSEKTIFNVLFIIFTPINSIIVFFIYIVFLVVLIFCVIRICYILIKALIRLCYSIHMVIFYILEIIIDILDIIKRVINHDNHDNNDNDDSSGDDSE